MTKTKEERIAEFREKLLGPMPMERTEYENGITSDPDIKECVDSLKSSGLQIFFNDKNKVIILFNNSELDLLIRHAKYSMQSELNRLISEMRKERDSPGISFSKGMGHHVVKNLISVFVLVLAFIFFKSFFSKSYHIKELLVVTLPVLLIIAVVLMMAYEKGAECSNDRIEWRSRMTLGVVMILSAVALVIVYFFKG